MKPAATALAALAILFSPALAGAAASSSRATCLERNTDCSLGELLDISNRASELVLSKQEHIAVLLEIITHLRRIITSYQTRDDSTYCADLSHDLRPGMTDAETAGDVSTLQFFLTSEQIYGGLVTGYYGKETAKAVYAWQRSNGIEDVTESTGVGKMTREKMRRASCPSLDSE